MLQEGDTISSLERSSDLAHRLRRRYPDRLPVVLKTQNDRLAPLRRSKFLFPRDATVAHVLQALRSQCDLQDRAIFLFTDAQVLLQPTMLLSDVHGRHARESILTLRYEAENAFGA